MPFAVRRNLAKGVELLALEGKFTSDLIYLGDMSHPLGGYGPV